MIEKIIAFLQWIQSSESLKKWVDRIFSYLILFVVGTLFWKVSKEILFDCGYGYYPYYNTGCSLSLPWKGIFETSVGGFFLIGIVTSMLFGAWKKLWSYEYSVMRLLLNTSLPFFVGFFLVSLWSEYSYTSSQYGPKWYIYFFGGLYALSPIIHFIKENNRSEGYFKKILRFYSSYIVSFLIGLAIFAILFGLGQLMREMRYMDFSEIVLFLFIVFCVFGIGTWMIITYAWDEVKPLEDASARNIRKGSVWIAGLFIFLWMSPDWKQLLIENRITTAQEILLKGGNTAETYREAASVWGLKWAMKESYLENRLYNKNLYATLFDTSIENDIDDEIDVNKYRAWNSNGTSVLARGENAKVELNFAKHESEIKADIGALETTVTYEFQNTDTQNQEVIYSIELPSSESVVTDLRLGLNLELTGTLAPRGAAEKVYTDSLRRNTDPALLEQTGPTTYRLRVFPVPSVSDSKTQGRQRVSFRYVTPIANGENITVMPKTDIINLKLTKKSEIVTRLMDGTKALIQESWKTNDIDDLIAGEKVSVKIDSPLKDTLSYCPINTYEGLDIKSMSGMSTNLTKNIVFLDISKSIGDAPKIKKRYQELVDYWKNSGAALDIYTFNSLVTSAGYDLSDIDFWGNTDMSAVIAYIGKNGIENANIVILTDDNSFEIGSIEDKSIDYKKLKSNHISLIQIGDKIRTLKTEVTKSILASDGNVYRLSEKSELDDALKNIFTLKKLPPNCETYSGSNTGSLSALEGGRDGKKVFGESMYGTGFLRNYIYPTYLYTGYLYSREPSPTSNRGNQTISDLDGNQVTLYYTYSTDSRGGQSQSGVFEVPSTGYYFLDGKTLTGGNSGSPLYIEKETLKEISDSELLEKIGIASHTINQSVSLIALENDRQRQDLERYSKQDGKYDTTYQNFDNTQGSPGWNRREILFDDMRAMPMSVDSVMPASRSSNALFGASKATEMQLGSTSSPSLGGAVLGLSSGRNSGTIGILQIIAIIILFPVMAWYVLRKKKPQAAPVVKKPE